MIEQRFWHADEILEGIEDEAFTEKLQHRLIGNFDANDTDRELMQQLLDGAGGDINLAHELTFGTAETVPAEVQHLVGEVRLHYTYSLFWRRRAALWAALGENNPAVYLPIGTAHTERGKELETSAQNLSMCLGVSTNEWIAPIWARFHLAKDPRYDATYNGRSGIRRLSLPVVTEIFPTEAVAKEAAAVDKAEMGAGSAKAKVTTAPTTTAKASSSTSVLAVPEAWGEKSRVDWIRMLGEEKAKHGGALPSMPGRVKIANNYACTPAEIEAWWDSV
jgi:hypothetical protein